MENLSIIESKLETLFHQATTGQRINGMNWYYKAYVHAKDIAARNHMSTKNVIGIISALSPNNKWERNLIDAESFIQRPLLDTKVCTFGNNRIKAQNIYGSLGTTQIRSHLGGRKTKSFFDNILSAGRVEKPYHEFTNEPVTVDLWMYRAAELQDATKNYGVIELAVQNIARRNKMRPSQVQAIIWTVLRQRYEISKQAKVA